MQYILLYLLLSQFHKAVYNEQSFCFSLERYSQSCGFFWSTLSWSLPAPSSSEGCASAVSPSSAAWPPLESDPFPIHFVFLIFLSLPFRRQLLTDADYQQKELFLWMSTLYSSSSQQWSTTEDQPVMHWSLKCSPVFFWMWPHLPSGHLSVVCSLKRVLYCVSCCFPHVFIYNILNKCAYTFFWTIIKCLNGWWFMCRLYVLSLIFHNAYLEFVFCQCH